MGDWWNIVLELYRIMDDVATTSNEKKAPPPINRLQKGYCTFYRTQVYLGSDLWVRVSLVSE